MRRGLTHWASSPARGRPARLSAVVRDMIPGGLTTFRSDVLNGLTGAPLQHGAFVLFALALVAAAVLGLAVMLLELALGAGEREVTLARLATMGLGGGSARGWWRWRCCPR